jgi:D-alanyl-D-alanine carboxypeptidase (penicillin-binding protein 5/6)
VPIASVAKVMTAYLAVQRLPPDARVVVDAEDAADTARRLARGESVVPVTSGEVLTRDEALTAMLLPSANNVAAMLADRVAGDQARFVALMDRAAEQLGMRDTTYTDPSGYRPSTVSTAHDQLLLWRAAMGLPVLARLLGLPSAQLPGVGRVDNTDRLLGRDGFVAGKTGSASAAGGCLAFRVVRDGRVLDAVVLGQRGGRLVDAGLAGAVDLARQALGTTGAR